jgi:hypothetical protein
MPEQFKLTLKQLICKNDDCMHQLGLARIKVGIVSLKCDNCKQISTWRINYGKGQEDFDILVDATTQKGGE